MRPQAALASLPGPGRTLALVVDLQLRIRGVTHRKFSGPARDVGKPEPGYFLMRLVRGGPQVPARICRILPSTDHPEGLWWAEVNGETYASHADPSSAPMVFRIWHGAEFSTAEEYQYRLKLKRWAETHQPDHPAAKPRAKIDRLKTPTIF